MKNCRVINHKFDVIETINEVGIIEAFDALNDKWIMLNKIRHIMDHEEIDENLWIIYPNDDECFVLTSRPISDIELRDIFH